MPDESLAPSPRRPWSRSLAYGALACVAYLIAARLSLRLAVFDGNITPLWPPAAVALCALWFGGRPLWPAVALGAALSTYLSGTPPLIAALVGGSNGLAALVQVTLLRRARFSEALSRLGDVLALVAFGALVPAVLSALLGVLLLTLGGVVARAQAPLALTTWALGDAVGVLIFAPPLLTLVAQRASLRPLPVLGGLGLCLGAALCTWGVLLVNLPITWSLLALSVCAGLWLGPSGGAAVSCAIASVATLMTAHGYGPYSNIAEDLLHSRLFFLEGFLATTVITTLLLGAAVAEARAAAFERARMQLSAVEAREREAFGELLLAIVGHDLRNPLAAVKLSAASLLRRGELSARDRRSIERVTQSTERMGRIIDQILDFTRGRLAGGIPIDRGPVDLHEVCQQVLGELRLIHEGRTLRFVPSGSGTGLFDRARLAQVVANLVDYALQRSSEDTAVELRVFEDGEGLRMEVQSQGPPPPATELRRLFDPFHRTTSSVSQGGTRPARDPAAQSLGLGLYIVKEIVAAHGGSVAARAAPEGLAISVFLPRALRVPAVRSSALRGDGPRVRRRPAATLDRGRPPT